MAEEDSLTGEVRNVIFHNEDNNYTVCRIASKEESSQITVVGILPGVAAGDNIVVHGRWKQHPKFGRQFEADYHERVRPATEAGVIRFLKSSSIKGVGEAIATEMVSTFGIDVLDILDDEPEKLLKVKGISQKKLDVIKESWSSQREIKNLILFLHSHDVSPTYAARIFNLYGSQSVARISENPYELAYDIRGIGFKTADTMALKLGFAPDSFERIEAAIIYTLFSVSERGGHMFYPKDKLMADVCGKLGGVDCERVEDGLDNLENKKRIRIEDLPEQDIEQAVFLMHFYRFEEEICKRLHGLVNHPSPVSREKVEQVLPEVEEKLGFQLSDEQREAVFDACINKFFIITGGPGTGKTTITKAVVTTLRELGLKVKLAAPTGRAAKRLSEATGRQATTIHRMLQFTPESGGFFYNEDQKLKADVLVVDEASMLDCQLCLAVLRAVPLTCRVIFVGDVNQLPSVGPGNVLSDLLQSGQVPSAVLNHIFRQAQESYIVVNAHRINDGEFPLNHPKEAPESDFYWIPQENLQKVQDMIVQSVCERIPERYFLDPMTDIQVLTPMHKGEVGTQRLNQVLQEKLNPAKGAVLTRGNTEFRVGDRILQLRNNYEKEVFNGDLGRVFYIDKEEGELTAEFDGNIVHYESSELDELSLAYAVSVHKSQGSEYPAVVMPVVTQHYLLLQRNLLYTALTRARRLAVLVGGNKAFQIGLNNVTAGKRFTHLRYRIKRIFEENSL
ncbi:SF1B family DNA helicase RecD2 [Maridesulfovibrio bastinii]|uniref:SF1B family DNA helicase RecD2 n=1 Tax=Maridesulfovibrio bastinii TaxID=47157 RepID=UPI0004216CC3|nr:ATP-dependent RecD-like DNA helicase [Maridesulfovibrio bastinii]